MLVNLTINPIEHDRKLKVCEEFDINPLTLVTHPSNNVETGIYLSSHFSPRGDDFLEFTGKERHMKFKDEYCLFEPPIISKFREDGSELTDEEYTELREEIFSHEYKSQYGVCDSVENVKEYFKEEIEDPNNKYFIILSPIGKDWGFRWHKNGIYIGKHEIQCEYYDDEEMPEDITIIFTFHIYKVKELS